jgi:hypothetical protein
MRKNISTMMIALAALSIGLHPASASLLGMPLNLKVVIELRNIEAPSPAYEFNSDDVLTDPLLVRGC